MQGKIQSLSKELGSPREQKATCVRTRPCLGYDPGPAKRCQPAHAVESDGEGVTDPILPRENTQHTEDASGQLTRYQVLETSHAI